MKKFAIQILMIVMLAGACNTSKKNLADTSGKSSGGINHRKDDKLLFIDVHHLGAGNVTYEAVMNAHKKDLEMQDQFGVRFIKFWVDEKNGTVMCLSEARTAEDVVNTHRNAHGLLPDNISSVKQGE